MKRVFVAINLPENVKQELADWQEIHKNMDACPVRSREGSPRTKQDAEHVRGFVRGSQRASASNGIRWTKKDNLHITLYFIGWIEEEKIENIISDLKAIAEKSETFDIYLTEITVGPTAIPQRAASGSAEPSTRNEKTPRMIWIKGPTTEELRRLYADISEAIGAFGVKPALDRPFRLHLTLARKRGRIKPFSEEIDLKFRVESFELMESKLLRDEAEYGIIETFKLGV